MTLVIIILLKYHFADLMRKVSMFNLGKTVRTITKLTKKDQESEVAGQLSKEVSTSFSNCPVMSINISYDQPIITHCEIGDWIIKLEYDPNIGLTVYLGTDGEFVECAEFGLYEYVDYNSFYYRWEYFPSVYDDSGNVV
jgi:hypothetical protein